MTRISNRIYLIVSGLVIVAGSWFMHNGGVDHPTISSAMGPLGSPEFFRSFAELMVETPDWRVMHTQIMIGPILWAIGGIGLAAWLRAKGERLWSTTGVATTAMGGVLWIMTYMNDGFVSQRIAPALLNAPPEAAYSLTTQFGASQEMTITLATPAWLLIAGGTLATAIGIATTYRSTRSAIDRAMVVMMGGSGAILGIWPAVALVTGTFDPGPMLSPWWALTASGMQVWYAAVALWLVVRAFVPAATTGRREAGQRTDVEREGTPILA